MKGILVSQLGNSSVLNYTEIEEKSLKPQDVKIKIHAAGINFIDIYYRKGIYPRELPYVPGGEGSGIITETGSNVSNFRVGDRIAFISGGGAYAEFVTLSIPTAKLVKLPDTINFLDAAAFLLQGLTAHYLTHSTFAVNKTHIVLIHAAAGGTGLFLVQISKFLGAFVIGTTSTAEKAKRVKIMGADVVCTYDNFAEKVQEVTNGRGVDVVYDSVGKTTFSQSLASLKSRGMLVLFGQSSGLVDPIDIGLLGRQGLVYLTRPRLTDYIVTTEEFQSRCNDMFQWLVENKIQVTIDTQVPLKDAATAHDRIESRQSSGKIVLIP